MQNLAARSRCLNAVRIGPGTCPLHQMSETNRETVVSIDRPLPHQGFLSFETYTNTIKANTIREISAAHCDVLKRIPQYWTDPTTSCQLKLIFQNKIICWIHCWSANWCDEAPEITLEITWYFSKIFSDYRWAEAIGEGKKIVLIQNAEITDIILLMNQYKKQHGHRQSFATFIRIPQNFWYFLHKKYIFIVSITKSISTVLLFRRCHQIFCCPMRIDDAVFFLIWYLYRTIFFKCCDLFCVHSVQNIHTQHDVSTWDMFPKSQSVWLRICLCSINRCSSQTIHRPLFSFKYLLLDDKLT